MMPLVEDTLFGITDKVQIAIDRLRAFEPPEGYYLAFSGGKDSQVIYHLAIEAGVKFDAHNNHTTVDPPELVAFVRKNYPEVIIDKPRYTMWQLIVKKSQPPTRKARYCCAELKERGGRGRIVVTGVRWAESSNRRNSRAVAEIIGKTKAKTMLLNDNEENRRLFESCTLKGKRVINPIIDWQDADVWEYLNGRGIEHCCLYDEGFTRLGCIGCPLAGGPHMELEFKRWPKYKKGYIRAFDRMLAAKIKRGGTSDWKTGEEVMQWWLKKPDKTADQESLFEEDEGNV